jgi:capsular polysaccharide biosynthesis protein
VTALDLVKAARRHLVALLVCLAVTCVGTAGVFIEIPVHYVATSELVVLSPDHQVVNGQVEPVNPFLSAGDQAAQVTASALAAVTTNDSFTNQLKARGFATQSVPTVVVATSGGGVVLDVSVDNTDANIARRDLGTLATLIGDTLRGKQTEAGSPDNQLFTLRSLVGSSEPTKLSSDRSRLTGIAFGLGLLLTILVVVVLEGRRRFRLNAAARAEEETAATDAEEVDDGTPPEAPLPRRPPHHNGALPGGPRETAVDGVLDPVVHDRGTHDNGMLDTAVLETVRNRQPVHRDRPATTAPGPQPGPVWPSGQTRPNNGS